MDLLLVCAMESRASRPAGPFGVAQGRLARTPVPHYDSTQSNERVTAFFQK